jgi:nucleotide-binding universal stress UspA family protein
MESPNIIVGVDDTPEGERALGMALRLAKRMGATIHIAHAITSDELASPGDAIERQDAALGRVPRAIWKAVERVLGKNGVGIDEVDVWQHVRLGKPVEVIRQVAVDYDAMLVVVGTRGNKGMKKLVLGSVADSLVHDGRFPVLVAHPNKIAEMEKTTFPDEPHPGDADMKARPEGAHLYRSSLIDAWKGLGRPSSPDFR